MRTKLIIGTILLISLGLIGQSAIKQTKALNESKIKNQELQQRQTELEAETAEKERIIKDQKNTIDGLNTNRDELLKQKAELNRQLSARNTAVKAVSSPVVAKVAQSGGCEQYRALVAQYNWNVDTALSVMKAESGCNPNAVSPTADHGLMQLHNRPVYDPAQNIQIAYTMWASRGWQPWSVCVAKLNCI